MFETFGIVEWTIAFVLTALLTIIVAILVLPWYRKRQETEYDNILSDDLVEDDISIILVGTVTQKDLRETIKLLKEVSVAVKRTEQKATALEKMKQYKTKIEEGKKKIKELTAEIQSTN